MRGWRIRVVKEGTQEIKSYMIFFFNLLFIKFIFLHLCRQCTLNIPSPVRVRPPLLTMFRQFMTY